MQIILDLSQVKTNFNQPDKRKKVIIIMLVAVILSVSFYFINSREYKTWQSTSGVLTKVEQDYNYSANHNNRERYILYYSYTVDAVEYTDEEDFRGKIPDSEYVGKAVEIWYNPDHHSQSSYNKPTPSLPVTVLPLFIAASICLFVLGARRKTVHYGF